MTSEVRLLLAACATAIGARDAELLPPLVADVSDWDAFVALAARHAVAPLVYRPLAAQAASRPLAHALDALRALFEENARRNLVLTRHLLDAVDALEHAGIPALPIKGPVLAVSAYGDIAARQFGDLDVLVPRRDIGRARTALAELGYRWAAALDPGPEQALMGADYHLALEHPAAGVTLEVHWALGRGGAGAMRRARWAWRHAQRMPLLGRELHTLSREALLVYLCVHATKHAWQNLQMVCDVAAVTHAGSRLDWLAVEHLARDTGARRAVAIGLALTADLLAPAPSAPSWGLTDAAATRLATAASLRLRDASSQAAPLPLADVVRFQLRARERRRDALAYAAHLLAAPQLADASAVSLPQFLHPLYYLFRPLRLCAKYVLRRRGQRQRTEG